MGPGAGAGAIRSHTILPGAGAGDGATKIPVALHVPANIYNTKCQGGNGTLRTMFSNAIPKIVKENMHFHWLRKTPISVKNTSDMRTRVSKNFFFARSSWQANIRLHAMPETR